MTTHYIDITLLPDPEFSHTHLLGALVAKLHRALVQGRTTDIGVSYPQHVAQPLSRRTLGSVLRLHGTPDALQRLKAQDWLKGMRDHTRSAKCAPCRPTRRTARCAGASSRPTPTACAAAACSARGETADQATTAIPDSVERQPDLPFVQLRSGSTGQPFCLCVEHGPLLTQPVSGTFNAYGLGHEATVPWF
jgi:CRISPR-associated endonuclease Csy4